MGTTALRYFIYSLVSSTKPTCWICQRGRTLLISQLSRPIGRRSSFSYKAAWWVPPQSHKMISGGHTVSSAYVRNHVLHEWSPWRSSQRKIEVGWKEDEDWTHLNEFIFRWGSIHSNDEKITLYTDGSSPKKNMLVGGHRETIHCHDLNFEVSLSLC